MSAPTSYGEVYDRGYRHYEGPRQGRLHAIWALARYSMARALGVKKGWSSKVIPILLYVGALLPVIVVIGVSAFFPAANILDYPGLFATIFLLEGIFVATIAPELLCPDRREGTLPLYFSRAMTRPDYVTGKLLAAGLLTLSISLTPALILWLGKQFLSGTPLQAMRDNAVDLWKILVAGALIALYLGAIGLLVSSFTKRKGVAVGIIILGFTITEAFAGALAMAVRDVKPWNEWVEYLSPSRTAAGLVNQLWPPRGDRPSVGVETSALQISLVMLAVIAVCCLVMFRRYGNRD